MLQIDGFAPSSYRSFGEALQYFGPLGKINLVIGQNNSGKSNVLRFVSNHLEGVTRAARDGVSYSRFSDLDQHIGSTTGHLKTAFGLNLSGALLEHERDKLRKRGLHKWIDTIDIILRKLASITGTEVAWFTYEASSHSGFKISPAIVSALTPALEPSVWATLWTALTSQTRGGLVEHWVPGTIHAISPVHNDVPDVAFIPAIREVRSTGGDASTFSGAGIIERLARLQHPGHNQQDLKKVFGKINDFLRRVTESDSAAIEIPDDRSTIIVHLNGRVLPLESLGTGIHEVVIIAAATTILSGQLVCIEEPEIHLHPLLQRKLLEHLNEATDNQYFIATHSGHLLDEQGVDVFHIQLSHGTSLIRRAVAPSEKFGVCVDLGYKSSDLLQANCIIWVEGPSDRIYLRHWLSRVDPALVEGTHYSIMFYGGRLLSHLTANDPEVEEFISLRRLNRFISILIDSDKASPRNRLNPTKQRIRKEFDAGPGFAWVTAGREIENYIPPLLLEKAIREVHKNVASVPKAGQFGEVPTFINIRGKQQDADKVKVACKLTAIEPNLGVLDLRKNLDKLVRFIREANGA